MDLNSDANLKLLLSYTLAFEDHFPEASWAIIKGWLSQQKVVRFKALLDPQFVGLAFARLNKLPLVLLLNTLKVPFSFSMPGDDQDGGDKIVELVGLSEIKIGTVS